MSDHQTLLTKFVSITEADEDRAKFYLESSAWQLEVALASFYEEDGNSANDEDVDTSSAENQEQLENREIPKNPPSTPNVKVTTSQPKQRPKSNFATVSNFSSSSSDEEGQAFYAGGSEHSGQQVLGPPKKEDFVSEMFKSAKEHGAEVVHPHSSNSSAPFLGRGYKLGQGSGNSEIVPEPSSRPQQSNVNLKLWREGFSINDGELRSYTDPGNREFLDYIKRGEYPPELVRDARGTELHLHMEDHRHEEFAMAKPRLMPFSGKGHTLGSPVPVALGSPDVPQVDKEAHEREAKKNLNVDKTQPTTNIQIRLADGSRLLGEFNLTHTVSDIRRYIQSARPQFEFAEFTLMTSFPNRELSDPNQTISDAGLQNVALLQRLK